MSKRNWQKYLEKKLTFPFMVERIDDTDSVVLGKASKNEPFRLGHTMKAVAIESDDDHYGIILKVREGRRIAFIPALDLSLVDETDPNCKYLEEYGEWFANSR